MSLKFHSKQRVAIIGHARGGGIAEAVIAMGVVEAALVSPAAGSVIPSPEGEGKGEGRALALLRSSKNRQYVNSLRRNKKPINGKAELVNYASNYAGGSITVRYSNEDATAPAEICIYDEIGDDPWSNLGFSAKDLQNALATIPRNRELHIRVNSPGGDVHQGATIKALLDEWPNKVIVTIDGVAASTASWMILGADEVRATRTSQMFIHDAMTICFGNAADFTAAAADLDKTSDQIAQIYADKTGKSLKSMRDKMRAETLLTGEEAKDIGLVDTLIDGNAKYNFTQTNLEKMREKLGALKNSDPQGAATDKPKTEDTIIMNRQKMIALLNKWGVKFDDKLTDAELEALVEAGPTNKTANTTAPATTAASAPTNVATFDPVAMQNQIDKLTTLNNQAHVNQVTADIDKLIGEDRLSNSERAEAIELATAPVTGAKYLNTLKKRPVVNPGVVPVSNGAEISVEASHSDIAKGFENFNEPTKAWQRGHNVGMDKIRDSAVNKAHFFRKHNAKLIQFANTNTIPAELKRQVILQEVIIDFARRLAPFSMFSTVFGNVPLEGTNKVEVPFYDLDSSASTSFVSGTGYTTIGNTVTAAREIEIGEGVANGDRLYQALAVSSQELARQPYLNVLQLAKLKAEKLASDIFTDVLGIVTAANYGVAAITSPADMFDSDDLADLKLACKLWPELGRLLMLDSAYDANLLKDPSFKHALNAASDSAIKEGRLFPRVMGFDYKELPTIPTNAENLVGFAAFKSAILVATAPVPPAEEVRNAGTIWEMVTDPQTGISLEFRRFGTNVTDVATHVIECSYGFAKGNGNALKRIVSA